MGHDGTECSPSQPPSSKVIEDTSTEELLIEYALGRPFGFTDENLASEIVSSARSKQFAVSEFVHSLVQRKAFRTK